MTCAADLTLYDLVALESQLLEVRRTQAQLQTVTGQGDIGAARMALTAAIGALGAVAMTTLELRRRVAAHDDDGGPGSIGELALRAQRWVITYQLGLAAQALHAEAAAARHAHDRQRFSGQLRSLGEVVAHVRDVFDRANAGWQRFRAPDRDDEPSADADARRAGHRGAVTAAARRVAALAADPEVACFLRTGASATAPVALRASCAAVRAALEISLDLEPNTGPRDTSTMAAPPACAWERR
jgi:hypothetical protein